MSASTYASRTYVTEERLDEETARLWAIIDKQTDALSHAFWALVWVLGIALVALAVAVIK